MTPAPFLLFGLPVPVIAAIVSAMFAIIAGVFGPLVQNRIGLKQAAAAQRAADAAMVNAKNAGVHAVASFRQEWINTVRNTLSEYHSILMSSDQYPNVPEDHLRKLSELGTRLELLLNPDEFASQHLMETRIRIAKCNDVWDRRALDPELVAAARVVLKAEWDRVKSELVGKT